MRLKSAFLPVAGVFGALSLTALVVAVEPVLMVVGFFGFGMAFVALQSALVMGAQSKVPQLRGTAMSLASFGMFVGGATGAAVNGMINNAFGPAAIYAPAAVFVLLAAFAARQLTGMKPKAT
ncbi:MAG: hypothetical protein LC641_03705 [Spirochaeta sp.]|nr:hypothetical protein [Spirochaeta sp.]